ncbi:S41 family peptidase [Paenibacillus gorillae]|uniref:S41 family peptidase n=1 Tax=Paenibacillus gorillae TaxID=1243662 RepID=UPI0005AA5B28|nr:S41 family peptidase [Paenibacillus gorillae]
MFDSIKWLTVYEMVLCLLHLFILVRYAVPVTRKSYRWIDFLPSAGMVIALVSFLAGDSSILAIAFYFLTVLLFLSTIGRLLKPAPAFAAPKGVIVKITRVVLSLCGIIFIGIAIMSAGEIRYNPVSNFSQMSYSDAFVRLNERLSVEYPFGEWKRIDWEGQRQKYEPLFKQAEQTGDKALYYKTLREYLASMRDGHIRIANDKLYDNPIYKQEGGGGFGLSTLRLDNGKVLVTLVLKDSPADRSGIRAGAEITKWNGEEARQAYQNTEWSDSPNTNQNENVNRGRFMVRAAIGQEVEVEFKNTGATETVIAKLTAYDDQYETLRKTKPQIVRGAPSVEGEILSNGYGYVRISSFLSNTAVRSENSLKSLLSSHSASDPAMILKEQLESFLDKGVKGLIIDLRDNPGGEDSLVVKMAGYFVNQGKRYSYASYYNRNTGKFERNSGEDYVIKPSQPYFNGKIAILVNGRTASSGEGLPLALKGMPNVTIVGFTGTNGSFGIMTSPIIVEMPEGYTVESADGRALDEKGIIQGDGDYTGRGGAVPDVIIPLNEETFTAKYVEGQDVELKYAIEAMEK